MKAVLALGCASALALGGCANLTAQQRENLQLELSLAKQIGGDVVRIWCATSGIIYVIANDTAAQSRVTNALAKNAKTATDACPLIAKLSGIEVDTPQTAPAAVPKA